MEEQELRATVIQRALGLSEQDTLKVLVFIAGLQAGKALQVSNETDHQQTTRAG